MGRDRSRYRRCGTFKSLLVLGILLTTNRLLADDEASARARQHFERGYALAAQGNFADAIEEFERAQAASPNVSLLYNLGQAYAAAGRSSDAVTTLERYLSQAGDELTPERRNQVEMLLRYHSARVGRVSLNVTPAGAHIAVDGKPFGVAPLSEPLVLPVGVHTVVLTAPGFEPSATSVDIQSRQTSDLTLELTPLASGAASLLLLCEVPDVAFSVDGAPLVPLSSPLTLPVSPGQHLIRFSRVGYTSNEQRFTAAITTVLRVHCRLRADPKYTERAQLRVRHPVGTAVLVDGVPFNGQTLPAGTHDVRVRGNAFMGEARRVSLPVGQTTELTFRPLPQSQALLARDEGRRRTLRLASFVAAGLGAAAAITATALYVDNASRWRAWDQRGAALRSRSGESGAALLGEVDALLDEENAIRNRDTAAFGLGIAGGALLSGAAALFVMARPPAEHWTLTGHAGVGLSYGSAF
jgi:tetratricopeptide (TPR) repeat protein